jgi:hypothetical protein
MTREQYIQMRTNGNFNIVHNFYSEKFDHSKHKPFLSMMELATFLPSWGNLDAVFEKCCRYYDEKFDVKVLLDKDGNVIKIL